MLVPLPLLAGLTSVDLPRSVAHAHTVSSGDIVETAVSAGEFNTLGTALPTDGLVDTLKGPGPFTVFAPTDVAFAKLPSGTLESLLANPDQLRTVLTYHVVAGADTVADVGKLQEATTVTVTQADIVASNGVSHVVDTVLLPQSRVASQTVN